LAHHRRRPETQRSVLTISLPYKEILKPLLIGPFWPVRC
jgi:hypothetical protein